VLTFPSGVQRSLATIHAVSITISNTCAPFGTITAGKIEITAPIARMTFPEIVAAFVIVIEGNPDIF
jgi:hypothetical protein